MLHNIKKNAPLQYAEIFKSCNKKKKKKKKAENFEYFFLLFQTFIEEHVRIVSARWL